MDLRESLEATEQPAAVADGATRPGDGYLIVQAALFYLEAAVLSLGLAALACSLSFGVLAQVVKWFGLEQSGGPAVDVAMFALVGGATVATLVYVFVGYFRLLAKPVAGRIVCAIAGLLWALPAGLVAPALLKPVMPGYRMLGTWAIYLAVAGLIYWLKRRAVRL